MSLQKMGLNSCDSVFVEPNRVTQVKTVETDGYTLFKLQRYTSMLIVFLNLKLGHFAKAGVEPGDMVCGNFA